MSQIRGILVYNLHFNPNEMHLNYETILFVSRIQRLTASIDILSQHAYNICMPTLLKIGPYRIVIYTRDHDPAHVHVIAVDRSAKIDINTLEVLSNSSISSSDLKQILKVIQRNRKNLLEAWNEIRKDQK